MGASRSTHLAPSSLTLQVKRGENAIIDFMLTSYRTFIQRSFGDFISDQFFKIVLNIALFITLHSLVVQYNNGTLIKGLFTVSICVSNRDIASKWYR